MWKTMKSTSSDFYCHWNYFHHYSHWRHWIVRSLLTTTGEESSERSLANVLLNSWFQRFRELCALWARKSNWWLVGGLAGCARDDRAAGQSAFRLKLVLLLLQTSFNPSQPIHPLLQGTYTGVRTTILGNLFFPPFLTKTKREWPIPGHIHGEFWPHSLQFALWFLVHFWPTEAPLHQAPAATIVDSNGSKHLK